MPETIGQSTAVRFMGVTGNSNRNGDNVAWGPGAGIKRARCRFDDRVGGDTRFYRGNIRRPRDPARLVGNFAAEGL
jgi:hypothetical protein